MRPPSRPAPASSGTPFALLSVVMLLGCAPVQPEPGVSPQDAPKLLAQAICPRAYDCCMASDLAGNDQAGTDVASCESKTEAAITGTVSQIEASERKGRVNYDGLKVQDCLDYLNDATTTCGDLHTTFHLAGLPACATFLEPKVAVGGGCTNDFECVDGFCDTTGAAAGADGACRALGQIGDSCANMGRCEGRLSCEAMTCEALTVASPPPPAQCFYSSACSYGGGDRGAASLLGIGVLVAAVLTRRRPARNAKRRPSP
jgi:hypothetical protein